MLKFACFCLVLAAATPLWSQVEPSATGGGYDLDDEHMMTPPPVSRDAYPMTVGSESRSNYLSAGMAFTAAYQDNLLLGNSKVSDENYEFLPMISFDHRTSRQGESLEYSSGFDLYQHTSQLNGISQNGSGAYRFHLSPYAIVVFEDTLQQNYNVYNQGNPFTGGGVSGNSGSQGAVLVAPFANRLGNETSAAMDYQYGKNAMVGGGASYSFLSYSEPSTVQGLNNENTTEADAFWSRRLGPSEYVGLTYQFSKFITHPLATYTLSHTVFGFYTHYFTKSFSASVLVGPEHYTSWSADISKTGAWTPAVQGSLGWQRAHTNLTVSVSHIVSGAGGLVGTYRANMASMSARVSLSRTWDAGAQGGYSSFKSANADPLLAAVSVGGHTLSSGIYVEHPFGERVMTQVGYQHFTESYEALGVTSPDSNREYLSVIYHLKRPLGR